ncbi:hypothetical protein, partial [Streptomyces sp. GC420]|uniref:hypothetical protein n=1 Tax=Streptomyces sp. GC420 TaxID=2697568 RepID=UPI001AA1BC64
FAAPGLGDGQRLASAALPAPREAGGADTGRLPRPWSATSLSRSGYSAVARISASAATAAAAA